MKFSGYFLIVWDFIKYAREHDIPVGPGRGSAAGSLVAYVMEITEHRSAAERAALRALPQSRARLDARYRHRLLHEPPRRSHRLRHPQVRPRPGRADHHLQHHGRKGRDQRRGPRARHALRRRRPHRQDDPDHHRHHHRAGAQRLAAAARRPTTATRRSRSSSTPPASSKASSAEPEFTPPASSSRRSPLTELVPVTRAKNDEIVTAYDMKAVEKMGLLKMDFLGLTTLTVIDDASSSSSSHRRRQARHRDDSARRPRDLRASLPPRAHLRRLPV